MLYNWDLHAVGGWEEEVTDYKWHKNCVGSLRGVAGDKGTVTVYIKIIKINTIVTMLPKLQKLIKKNKRYFWHFMIMIFIRHDLNIVSRF